MEEDCIFDSDLDSIEDLERTLKPTTMIENEMEQNLNAEVNVIRCEDGGGEFGSEDGGDGDLCCDLGSPSRCCPYSKESGIGIEPREELEEEEGLIEEMTREERRRNESNAQR
jgi:hypothetical protein